MAKRKRDMQLNFRVSAEELAVIGIYAPVRVLGDETIVTNGDQTDTVYRNIEHKQ